MATATTAKPAAGIDLKAALKEAGFAALVTLGLCIPIIAWGTRQNMDNVLVLDPRWDAVAWAVAIVFVGRFLVALRQQQKAGSKKPPIRLLPHGTLAFFQRHSRLFSVFGLGFLAAFPAIAIGLAGWGGALKWVDNFGVQILIYVMLGWGLNIVVGLAGLLDLGYVAFYAVGAYSYALLAKNFGLSFWILLPMAGILAAFWGMLLGFPVLRLRGDYLAIVTLAFGEIIRLVLINWTEFSNGYAGISGIPRPTFFGIPFTAADNGFAAVFGLEFSPLYRTIFLYYLILCLALLTAFVTLRLRRLPVGRAWEALREDEIACRSLGINTTSTKLTAFALGAMFGGFAGAFFSARQGFISPESFTFMESAVILAIVVLGGMGSLWGVAIAAIVMIGGTELLRELEWMKAIFGADFDPTKYRMLIFGFAMVVIMIWKPRGLISTREPTAFLKEKKQISADLVQEGHG
ncbi:MULTISPECIES: high-affinity branched-chain amino acid ABC transporter permease LivM [unclassified Bosea (in: a-proteobacteria)]|uniref:high-affinity branched-chain amino acid ABC transporter permease LivM n=1 Tax=unclassified Bosea (in: a-proteobacteria) TaxID=2653178 RepID=UPI00095496BE|nr:MULTISPECIES: high-affinity branched-chain amino acid ABC transporter permease LivM [unclassified Bosea (in: a-proteobacteria)]TAJ31395.1 MAG: high-affinity branched-chain amino acid ABC transporter permease LivM [Bosea sp. (in: a-proteobacteria)]SIQ80500.1 general L-amino acid ABC transporter membrane protein [Bosea sp. TND4EK4]